MRSLRRRRRRLVLGALLAATVVAGAFIVVVPAIAAWITALFAVASAIDIVLLRRHRVAEAERSMAAAFRAPRHRNRRGR